MCEFMKVYTCIRVFETAWWCVPVVCVCTCLHKCCVHESIGCVKQHVPLVSVSVCKWVHMYANVVFMKLYTCIRVHVWNSMILLSCSLLCVCVCLWVCVCVCVCESVYMCMQIKCCVHKSMYMHKRVLKQHSVICAHACACVWVSVHVHVCG